MFHTLFQNLVYLIIGLYKDRNISFHFRLRDTFPFLKIGVFSVGSEVMNYFSRELDVIIISATLGKETLGLYSLCKKLIMAAYSAINPILTKVLTPMLAKLQNDIEHIKKVYYNVIETVAFANFPIFLLAAIFSYGILNYLYGSEYTEGRYVLGVLAIYYGNLTTGNPVGSLQTALGRADTGFYWNICRIAICSFAVFLGSQFSLEAVCICLFLLSLCSTPLSWRITIKPLIGGDFWEFFFVTFKPFSILFLLAVPFYIFFAEVDNIIAVALLSVLYLVICTCAMAIFFKNSFVVQKVFDQLRKNGCKISLPSSK